FGLAGPRKVGAHVQVADSGPASARRHDERALGAQLPRDRESDAGRRARDDADVVAQAEIHAAATLAFVTTILLVRHGQSEWNREGRWQGHADPPLSDAGRRQARELADR